MRLCLCLVKTPTTEHVCFLYNTTANLTSNLDLRRPLTNLRSVTSSNQIAVENCSVWTLWWITCLSYTRAVVSIVILNNIVSGTGYFHKIILFFALVHRGLVAVIYLFRTIEYGWSSDLLIVSFACWWDQLANIASLVILARGVLLHWSYALTTG